MGDYEYALLIVKPDGVQANITEEAVQFFKEKGMVEIGRKKKVISKYFILENFSSKCKNDIFFKYLSEGQSEAILLKGYNAYDRMRIGKVEFRKKLGVDGKIENIIHSPEAGNEYERQLYYFFPEIRNLNYCMYADIYVKTFYCNDEKGFIDSLICYDQNTNSKLVYVFQSDEYGKYKDFFKKYIEIAKKSDWLFGIEYCVEYKQRIIKVVGYYKVSNIDNIGIDNRLIWSIQKVIQEIKEKKGISYLGYSRLLLDMDDVSIKQLKYDGVDGIIMYHPMYSVEDTAYIRERYLACGFMIGGGSGGISEPGRYSIAYGMLRSLYDKLHESDVI